MAFGRLERSPTPQPMSDINMTPLIDVMLVLLVIFMIAAPLMTSSLKMELPKVAAATSNEGGATLALELRDAGAQGGFQSGLQGVESLGHLCVLPGLPAGQRSGNGSVVLLAKLSGSEDHIRAEPSAPSGGSDQRERGGRHALAIVFSRRILACSCRMPYSSASAVGGQPGT